MDWKAAILIVFAFSNGLWALNSENSSISEVLITKIKEKLETEGPPTIWSYEVDENFNELYHDHNDDQIDIDTLPHISTTSNTTTMHTIQANQTQWNATFKPKNEAMELTLKLLQEGTEQMSQTIPDDIILVMGNTGAGKSTMTLFITGDNSELIAYEKDPVTILIKDLRYKISNSTIVSKTIYPELFIDEETDASFYDCPGFSDTRNTTIEIANSFFIKKLAESAKRVKVVLVVNHNSLKPGGDRKDFMLLVKHTTDFLRNIDNFNNSIALIATKCESRRSASRVIKGMVLFLEEAKSQFHTILSGDDLLSATKLIDVLLQQDEKGHYLKLTYFQQPDETGPLSEIGPVQDRKEHIKHVIYNNINFTAKSPDDFGYSISPQAKNDVRNLSDTIEEHIIELFENVGTKLDSHYKTVLQHSKNSTLEGIKHELKILFKNTVAFQDLTTNNTDTSAAKYVEKIVTMNWPNFHLKEAQGKVFEDAINNGEYLDFLDNLTQTKTSSELLYLHQRWTLPISNFLSNIKTLIIDFSHQQNEKVLTLLTEVNDKLIDFYHRKFTEIVYTKSLKEKNFKDTLVRLLEFLDNWENTNEEAVGNMKLSEFTNELLVTFNSLSPTIFEESLQTNLRQNADFLDYIKSNESNVLTRHSQAVIDPQKWFENFKRFIPQVRSALKLEEEMSKKLRESLAELASTLQSFYIQKLDGTSEDLRDELEKDVIHFKTTLDNYDGSTKGNVSSIFTFIKIFTSRFSNFEPITQIVSNVEAECELLSILHNSQSQRENRSVTTQSIDNWISPLKNFITHLEETVKPPKCTLQKIKDAQNQITAIIQGTFVSLKYVTNSCLPLSQGIGNVLITSLHTVYLDTDLNGIQFNPESTLNVAIVSPNWVVNQNGSTINLNGATGKQQNSIVKNMQVFKQDGEGLDGQPGLPGGNGGYFLGIGHSITGGKVNIYTNGGRGGNGQNGTDGRNGAQAQDVDISKIHHSSKYMDGSNYVQIKIEKHDPYKYEERDEWGCTNTKNNDKEWSETFKLFGFLPIGTTQKIQKETVTMYHCRNYEFYDPNATPGKRGGNGGAPGLGGKGGVALIEFPSNYSEFVSIFSSDGDEGTVGQGGNGGIGGLMGNRVVLQFSTSGKKIISASNKSVQTRAPTGQSGSNGRNLEGRMQPAATSYNTQTIKAWSVLNFKTFADSNSVNPYIRKTLDIFLEQLFPATNLTLQDDEHDDGDDDTDDSEHQLVETIKLY